MKEMKYQKERIFDVLHKGNFKGYLFCIMSLGTHPCAYIQLKESHKYYKSHYDGIPINCHGGLTFASTDFHFNPVYNPDVWWIGWDYTHIGDYTGYNELFKISPLSKDNDKRWTTEEIFEEIKNVIEQLIKIKK
jgi:hypothetical protein